METIFDFISGIEFFVLLFLTAVAAVFLRNSDLNVVHNLGQTAQNFWLLLPDYAVAVMFRLFTFSFVLSLLLIIAVIWTSNKLMDIRQQMHEALKLPNQKTTAEPAVQPSMVNEKWEKVKIHINSVNPSDWKLAILECDIMLGEILEKMGYMQESIGEKLKSIEPSDFTNIEAAWEAHKIRNQIAHDGSDFLINEREAKRVVGLYEAVFREFEYI